MTTTTTHTVDVAELRAMLDDHASDGARYS